MLPIINQNNVCRIIGPISIAFYSVEENAKLNYHPSKIVVDLRTNQILSANAATLSFTRRTNDTWGVVLTEWNGYSRNEAIANNDPFPSLSEIITGKKGKKRPKAKLHGRNDFTAAAHNMPVPTSPPRDFVPSRPKPTPPKPKSTPVMKPTYPPVAFETLTDIMVGIKNYINVHANIATIMDVYVGDRNNKEVRGGGILNVNDIPISIQFVGDRAKLWHDNKSYTTSHLTVEQLAMKINRLVTPRSHKLIFDKLSTTQLDQLILITAPYSMDNNIAHTIINSNPS